ncbi:hypothetical protein KUTeg_005717 [Tegillarca granosa]|uniref:Uncharacterized protein n=1 Tax=Tegillarca granosa TaxID=220873 RepID=A0ABQ9FJF1_TEGGR|nr:hypothetical protein KUTeg_005717 [Tegillarca granosa]
MASVDNSDSDSDSHSESDGSDFDQKDNYSDRFFSSDTDSKDDGDSQSSIETLASDISNVHEDQFWTDELHDIDICQFEETVGPNHQLAPN